MTKKLQIDVDGKASRADAVTVYMDDMTISITPEGAELTLGDEDSMWLDLDELRKLAGGQFKWR